MVIFMSIDESIYNYVGRFLDYPDSNPEWEEIAYMDEFVRKFWKISQLFAEINIKKGPDSYNKYLKSARIFESLKRKYYFKNRNAKITYASNSPLKR